MLLEGLAEKMIRVISLIVTDGDAIPTLVYHLSDGSRELDIGFEQSAVLLSTEIFREKFQNTY